MCYIIVTAKGADKKKLLNSFTSHHYHHILTCIISKTMDTTEKKTASMLKDVLVEIQKMLTTENNTNTHFSQARMSARVPLYGIVREVNACDEWFDDVLLPFLPFLFFLHSRRTLEIYGIQSNDKIACFKIPYCHLNTTEPNCLIHDNTWAVLKSQLCYHTVLS